MGSAGEAFITITAVNKTKEGLASVNRSAEQTAAKVNGAFSGLGSGAAGAMSGGTLSGLAGVATAAAGVVAAFGGVAAASAGLVKKFSEVEKTLNDIRAVGGYSTSDIRELKASIDKVASSSVLTVQEVAAGVLSATRAGLNVNQAKAILPAAVAYSTASGTALDLSTGTIADLSKAFKIDTKEAARISDELIAAANSSNQSNEQLAEAMKNATAAAASAGLSFEKTAISVMGLADIGIKGADAGTLMKSALLHLTTQGEAKKVWGDLGFSYSDIAGNDLITIVNKLSNAMKEAGYNAEKQNESWKTLLGSYGLAAKNLAGVDPSKYQAAIENAFNRSAEVAAAKLDGLGGAIERGKSQLDVFATGLGEGLANKITPSLQTFVKLDLPRYLQQFKDSLENFGGGNYVSDAFKGFFDAIRGASSTVNKFSDVLQAIRDKAGKLGFFAGKVWDVAENAVNPLGAQTKRAYNYFKATGAEEGTQLIAGKAFAQSAEASIDVNEIERNLQALSLIDTTTEEGKEEYKKALQELDEKNRTLLSKYAEEADVITTYQKEGNELSNETLKNLQSLQVSLYRFESYGKEITSLLQAQNAQAPEMNAEVIDAQNDQAAAGDETATKAEAFTPSLDFFDDLKADYQNNAGYYEQGYFQEQEAKKEEEERKAEARAKERERASEARERKNAEREERRAERKERLEVLKQEAEALQTIGETDLNLENVFKPVAAPTLSTLSKNILDNTASFYNGVSSAELLAARDFGFSGSRAALNMKNALNAQAFQEEASRAQEEQSKQDKRWAEYIAAISQGGITNAITAGVLNGNFGAIGAITIEDGAKLNLDLSDETKEDIKAIRKAVQNNSSIII